MWAEVALLITWLFVVPYLILFPPALEALRLRWKVRQDKRKSLTLRVNPKWRNARSGQYIIPRRANSVLVFINCKSGGQLGAQLHSAFCSLLTPAQVFDLAANPPGEVLPKFMGNVRVVVCGGDGSIGWVMSAASLSKYRYPIAIAPLGTGNDLSRSLGWGAGFSEAQISSEALADLLARVQSARVKHFDRWRIVFSNLEDGAIKTVTMNNYFSIGIDAEIALNFHADREAHPELFSSQSTNLFRYAMYGVAEAFEGASLGTAVRLWGDSKEEIQVNELFKGLVVSNVPSYQGGADFWGSQGDDGPFTPVSMCDSKLEIMGLSGTFHVGVVHLGIDSALQLGQSHSVRLHVDQAMCVQVDGEPWKQPPCTIDITFLEQYPMLFQP